MGGWDTGGAAEKPTNGGSEARATWAGSGADLRSTSVAA